MRDIDTTHSNSYASVVRILCALMVLGVCLFSGFASAEASAMPHSHKAVMTKNDKFDSHSCPLLHHVKREVCPSSHQLIYTNGFVIKSCGGSPVEGGVVATGFSKDTVAPNDFGDFSLALDSCSPIHFSSVYTPVPSDPLDHPPKSIA